MENDLVHRTADFTGMRNIHVDHSHMSKVYLHLCLLVILNNPQIHAHTVARLVTEIADAME